MRSPAVLVTLCAALTLACLVVGLSRTECPSPSPRVPAKAMPPRAEAGGAPANSLEPGPAGEVAAATAERAGEEARTSRVPSPRKTAPSESSPPPQAGQAEARRMMEEASIRQMARTLFLAAQGGDEAARKNLLAGLRRAGSEGKKAIEDLAAESGMTDAGRSILRSALDEF